MKNLLEVLRMKEEEILRIRREIEALKITARLLNESEQAHGRARTPIGSSPPAADALAAFPKPSKGGLSAPGLFSYRVTVAW